MNILFPLKIDRSGNPISSIHGNISENLKSKNLRFTAFATKCKKIKFLNCVKSYDNKFLDAFWINLYSIINLYRFDVIHFVPNIALTPLFIISRLLRKTSVYTIHELPKTTEQSGFLVRHLIRFFATHSDKVVAVSEKVASQAKSLWGCESVVIHNGVDNNLFNPSREPVRFGGKRTFLFVGRLIKGKGYGLVLRLAKDFPDYTFVFVGAGTLPFKPDNVVHKNFVDPSDLAGYYTGADALIFPSSIDGFGMVYLEAMACGTPIIGLKNTTAEELAGELGFLAGNYGELCEIVKSFRSSDSLKKKLVKKANSDFAWPKLSEKYRNVYEHR